MNGLIVFLKQLKLMVIIIIILFNKKYKMNNFALYYGRGFIYII